jgi:hypothetical protein
MHIMHSASCLVSSDPVQTAQEKAQINFEPHTLLRLARYAGHHKTPNAVSVDRHDPDPP